MLFFSLFTPLKRKGGANGTLPTPLSGAAVFGTDAEQSSGKIIRPRSVHLIIPAVVCEVPGSGLRPRSRTYAAEGIVGATGGAGESSEGE